MSTNDPSNANAVKSAADAFTSGQKLAGCYTLKQKLESDSLAVIWLARDEELGRDMTLYFIPDAVLADTRAMAELRQEVKRNRQMIHPHVLRVHELIEESDWAAISMDYVAGETLAALKRKKPKQFFEVSEVKRWMGDLCQTLEDAQKIDMLHRDIAPENLIVTEAGSLVVANFGISRCVVDALSRSGQRIKGDGNLAYMSPQQLDGERPSKADDIYSMGAVIYELLTGKTPFHSGELVSQIRKSVPASMSQRRDDLGIKGEPIPENWEKAVAACLEKHTAQRAKTPLEVMTKLAIEKTAAPAAVAPAAPAAEIVEPPAKSAEAKAAAKRPAAKPAIPAEATVISTTQAAAPSADRKPAQPTKTAESKPAETKKMETPKPSESSKMQKPAELKKGATTPSGFPLAAFVEVESGPGGKRQKSKFPMVGVAAAITLIAIGVVGFMMTDSGNQLENKNIGFAPGTKTGGNQITPANNLPAERLAAVPPKQTAPAPVAEKAEPAKPLKKSEPPILLAAASPKPEAPKTSEPPKAEAAKPETKAAEMPAGSAQAQQLIAEKMRAAEEARQALAAAEKALEEKTKSKQQAEAAAQQAQNLINQKLGVATAAKKAAEEAMAVQKTKDDARKKADAEAEEAQRVAAEKARAAVEARKAAEETVQQIKEQQAQQQRVSAEAQELQKTVAEKQRIATEAAKAAADAEALRQQRMEFAKKAEADVAQAKITAEKVQAVEQARKAAEEAEALRMARAKERERLEKQAAEATQAAAEAQRLADAARKAVEDADRLRREQEAAQQKAEAAQRKAEAAMKELSNATNSPGAALPAATPVATPAEMASLTKPVEKAPTEKAAPGASKQRVDKALENSLGMKFAPVGDVFFSVWLIRVQDFEAFAKATSHKSSSWRQPGFKQGPDHPIVNVSWNDATAFCKWLTEKEQKEGLLAGNQSYRLPTDLEWSKAVGLPEEAGRTPEGRDMDVPDMYPWGTEWPPVAGAGNYTGEETGSDVAIKGYDDGFAWTSPVGSFKPNKLGLYDMGGNVWQWCSDWWNDEQRAKVLRGASWYNGALKLSLLSSCRVHAAPGNTTDNYGFRVVLATGGGRK